MQQLRTRLTSTAKMMAGIGAASSAAGAAMLAPLIAAGKTFASAGDNIDKMAARTSASAEWLSGMGFAAGQSGTDIQTLEGGIRRLQATMLDASQGSETALRTLAELGLTAEDLAGKSVEEQFDIAADALNRIQDPGKRAALAMDLFGKSGQKMLPLLSAGSAGMRAMRDEAETLGHVMTREDATAAAALTDAFGRLTAISKGVVLQIGAAMAPAMTYAAGKIRDVGVVVVDFIKNNRSLVTTIAAVGAGLIAAGTVLLGLGSVAAVASAAIGGIITVVSTLGSIAGLVFSPIGLAILAAAMAATALAATIGVAAYQSGLLGVVWDMLKTGAMEVWATVQKAFGGIRDAMSAGEYQLAAEILWAAIKKTFWEGFASITDITNQSTQRLLVSLGLFFARWIKVAKDAALSVAKIIANPLSAFTVTWDLSSSLNKAVKDLPSGGIHDWAKNQSIAANEEFDALIAKAAEARKQAKDEADAEAESGSTITTDSSVDVGPMDQSIDDLKAEIGSLENLTFGAGSVDLANLQEGGAPPDQLAMMAKMLAGRSQSSVPATNDAIGESVDRSTTVVEGSTTENLTTNTFGDSADTIGQAIADPLAMLQKTLSDIAAKESAGEFDLTNAAIAKGDAFDQYAAAMTPQEISDPRTGIAAGPVDRPEPPRLSIAHRGSKEAFETLNRTRDYSSSVDPVAATAVMDQVQQIPRATEAIDQSTLADQAVDNAGKETRKTMDLSKLEKTGENQLTEVKKMPALLQRIVDNTMGSGEAL